MWTISSYSRFLTLGFLVFFLIGLPVHANAQSVKPKLVEIILNDETNDPQAEKIIRKIYSDWIKENKTDDEVGEINARFVPLAKEGSEDKFIIGILYGEDFGGCYNRGCRTIILHSKGNNEWVGVFNAFVARTLFDENSKSRIKNLILSSSQDITKPGIWMWNGTVFQIVNNQ